MRSGFFEREQFEAVRTKLPDYLQPIATFAYITGWRSGEIRGLEWRNVDFKAGAVTLDPGSTKNEEGRIFPMLPELRTLLEGQDAKRKALAKKGTITRLVFSHRGQPIVDLRKAWRTACRKAEVPGRLLHDFRRTAVRNLVRAGISEHVAMKLTGHKTRSIFDRYDIVDRRDLDQAAERLQTFLETAPAKV